MKLDDKKHTIPAISNTIWQRPAIEFWAWISDHHNNMYLI